MRDFTIEELAAKDARVLLHVCCAPCCGAIVEAMARGGLHPTIFFSNSNIYTREEYNKRKAEVLRYCELFGLEVVDDDYDHPAWLDYARGLEKEPERGARCAQCFLFRLLRAARYAVDHGCEYLATTLASSRWKDLNQVNEAGARACDAVNGISGPAVAPESRSAAGKTAENPSGPVVWWPHNWRRGGLQERRAAVIREQAFYNQTFCGCEYSIHELK